MVLNPNLRKRKRVPQTSATSELLIKTIRPLTATYIAAMEVARYKINPQAEHHQL